MTLRINGKTITAHARFAARKAKWLGVLARNAAPKLNRLAGLIEVKASSLKPRKLNTLTLVYVGVDPTKDYARIQRVLGCTFDTEGTAFVQFSRIAVHVTLERRKLAVAA